MFEPLSLRLVRQRTEPVPLVSYGTQTYEWSIELLDALAIPHCRVGPLTRKHAKYVRYRTRDVRRLQSHRVVAHFGFAWVYQDAVWVGVNCVHPFDTRDADFEPRRTELRCRLHHGRIKPKVETAGGLSQVQPYAFRGQGQGYAYGQHWLRVMWPLSAVCRFKAVAFYAWAVAQLDPGKGL